MGGWLGHRIANPLFIGSNPISASLEFPGKTGVNRVSRTCEVPELVIGLSRLKPLYHAEKWGMRYAKRYAKGWTE